MPSLYNFTLQPPGGITHAVYGNFTHGKAQEIIIARNSILELVRPDDETGRLVALWSTPAFGIIRSLETIRLPSEKTDHVIVGSDSGKLIILAWDESKSQFVSANEQCFGKTGCRRIVPGQMIAKDPRGRAIMVAALEKQKFVYILHRDGEDLVLSSPLEAHKSHNVCFDCVGLDVGFENPLFACLEIDYEDVEEELKGEANPDTMMAHKLLTFYELDLGLNSVVRKHGEELNLVQTF